MGETNNKFITSPWFLSSDTDELKKKSDELLYTVLVTRYGPQSVASATWLKRVLRNENTQAKRGKEKGRTFNLLCPVRRFRPTGVCSVVRNKINGACSQEKRDDASSPSFVPSSATCALQSVRCFNFRVCLLNKLTHVNTLPAAGTISPLWNLCSHARPRAITPARDY